jgi:hypothetical protein
LYRGSAVGAAATPRRWSATLYLLIEAHAADADLVQRLPGLHAPLTALRAAALKRAPGPVEFPRRASRSKRGCDG